MALYASVLPRSTTVSPNKHENAHTLHNLYIHKVLVLLRANPKVYREKNYKGPTECYKQEAALCILQKYQHFAPGSSENKA